MRRVKTQKNCLLITSIFILCLMLLAGCGQSTVQPEADNISKQNSQESSIAIDEKKEKLTEEDIKSDNIKQEMDVAEAAEQTVLPPNANVTEEPLPSQPSAPEILPSGSKTADTIVVYFSATGHTTPLAKYAADYLKADLYEIIPEIPYTDEDLNYSNSSSRSSKEQNDASARPAISGPIPDLSTYDTIIIGHPIWWGQAPKIIYTFLESYDWSGKTLVTFCTSASSGLGSSAENLKQAASGNPDWLESRRFPIGAEKTAVIEWLAACQIQ